MMLLLIKQNVQSQYHLKDQSQSSREQRDHWSRKLSLITVFINNILLNFERLASKTKPGNQQPPRKGCWCRQSPYLCWCGSSGFAHFASRPHCFICLCGVPFGSLGLHLRFQNSHESVPCLWHLFLLSCQSSSALLFPIVCYQPRYRARLLAKPHSLADSEVFLVVFCEIESIYSVWLIVWLRDVLLQLGGLIDKTLLESPAASFAYTAFFIFQVTACVCRSHCPRIPRSLPFFLLSVILSLPDQLSCLSLYLPISR